MALDMLFHLSLVLQHLWAMRTFVFSPLLWYFVLQDVLFAKMLQKAFLRAKCLRAVQALEVQTMVVFQMAREGGLGIKFHVTVRAPMLPIGIEYFVVKTLHVPG